MFDERNFKDQLVIQTGEDFYKFVHKYDEQMVPVMKEKGYTCIHSVERTVAFTFGEFTFKRRRWKKGEHWVVPVDEKLGLKKNVRFSEEFMYQIAYLSTMMSYDNVVKTIETVYHITITKPTVVKAIKICDSLLEERLEYRFFEEPQEIEKKKANVIYIEGDGVMIRAKDSEADNKHFDFSHFLVHTGSMKVGSNRFELLDKKEFISLNNRLTRDHVLDYLFNHFEIDENTVLITNSDGGHGYTPYVFKEIAKVLKVKRHEHFWDAYHVNKSLKLFFKAYPKELLDGAFEAIKSHDKSKLRTVLDTTESLISGEDEYEEFNSFKRKLLNNFQYTKPAELRGFSSAGIGVMESQHRKITYRMKKRGMYWTTKGAETMSKIILLSAEGELRELFFGTWREEFQKMEDLSKLSATKIKAKQNKVEKNYEVQNMKYARSRALKNKI